MTMLRRRGGLSKRRYNTFMDFPVGGNNAAYVADSPALSLTGDMYLRFVVAFDDTTPATHQSIISKAVTSQSGYEVRLETDGRMCFIRGNAGATAHVFYINSSFSILPFAQAGVPLVYAINYDQINGAWSTVNAYYRAFNPMTYHADMISGAGWTLFGNDSDADQTATSDNAQPLVLGRRASSGTQALTGDLYAAMVMDATVTPVFDVDFGRITRKGVRDPAGDEVKDLVSGQTILYHTITNPAWDWGEAAA